MSTHNIGFYEEISKILSFNYNQISSNTHLISSAALISLPASTADVDLGCFATAKGRFPHDGAGLVEVLFARTYGKVFLL